MSIQNNIQDILTSNPKIPVVTFHELNQVEPTLKALVDQGIQCIEITLRTPIAVEAIQQCQVLALEGFSVGVGTILEERQVQLCQELGVDFMVSPGSSPDLIRQMQASGIPYLPGVMTPSEILAAVAANCRYLKLFPFNISGGAKALKTYANVFPAVHFCPTGGVNADNFQALLEMSNVLSVGGSWLV
jgi:2-dehydro-3-deoxyphosphogluconate aldolase/(4S)-4-hydroxy-2-oxoglutarate aldolase